MPHPLRPSASTRIALVLFALTCSALYVLYRLDTHPYLVWPRWDGPRGAVPPTFDGGVSRAADRGVPSGPGGEAPRDSEAGSSLPHGHAETVLVLDKEKIVRDAGLGSYSKRDSSAAWWNWLTQAVGPAGVLSPDTLNVEQTKGIRLLVLSRSAASSPPTQQHINAVQDVLARGGGVILECPSAGWRDLTGVHVAGEPRAGASITRTTLPISARYLPALSMPELPLRYFESSVAATGAVPDDPASSGELASLLPGTKSVAGDVEPLLWIDERPCAFKRNVGTGVVITLAVDLGYLWQTIQQGRPDDDLEVRNRYPEKHAPVLETNDMVAASGLLTSEVPIADLLEDALFRLVADEIALPGWWLYPHARPGAFLMSHDEEAMGTQAAWMAEAESTWSCPSTTFLVPSPATTSETFDRYARANAETALHYVLPGPDGQDYPGSGFDVSGRYETFGLWKVQPVRRLFEPAEQWQWLTALAAGGSFVPASRTHFLAWTPRYAHLFRSLAKAGIHIDSSYGPDLEDRGYLFGTARPFFPLDSQGLPLPVLELPFISAEDLGDADHAFLTRLLEDSATQTHQALSVLFHPNSFRWHPSVSNYNTWKSICREAGEMGHWITTFSQLDRFARARQHAELHSETIGDRLAIHYAFEEEGATLVLPETWRGKPFEGLEGQPDARTSRSEMFGAPVRLVEIPAGEGAITALYGKGG